MRITRFSATADGESRFTELDIPLEQVRQNPFGNIMRSSKSYVSPGLCFVELPAGMVQGWHRAPTRQIVAVLSGVLAVRTSDQQTRQWRAGEVFLAEDVTGKGHTTHVVEGPVRLVFVPLPPEFMLERWSV